jgi:hypothetical protein
VLAKASHGLTGADLKAVVEDGKLSFAHDIAAGRIPRAPSVYPKRSWPASINSFGKPMQPSGRFRLNDVYAEK